jgi:hypothetical protein
MQPVQSETSRLPVTWAEEGETVVAPVGDPLYIITVYALAIAANALIYTVIGAVTWPLANVVRKTRSHRHLT